MKSFRVKELAPALGVSVSYVYQMRACGFVMRGVGQVNRTATLSAARRWIRRTGFKVVNGRGVVGLEVTSGGI